jgi:hypothetical protein
MRIGYSWEGSAWPMHGPATGSCDPATVEGSISRGCFFQNRRRLSATILAESPLANSVSEREANDQGDSDFQHSDKCAQPATRPQRVTQLKGRVSGTPDRVFIKETRPMRQGSWPTLKPALVLATTAQGRVRPVLQLNTPLGERHGCRMTAIHHSEFAQRRLSMPRTLSSGPNASSREEWSDRHGPAPGYQ